MPSTAPESRPPLRVAVGVVVDAAGRVLIARRAAHLHQGGLWEFPGGKVEPGEGVYAALCRELAEELGIAVEHGTPLAQVEHDYGDRHVLLDVWWVDRFSGEPLSTDGEAVVWAALEDLASYTFPAANVAIVEAIHRRAGVTVS